MSGFAEEAARQRQNVSGETRGSQSGFRPKNGGDLRLGIGFLQSFDDIIEPFASHVVSGVKTLAAKGHWAALWVMVSCAEQI